MTILVSGAGGRLGPMIIEHLLARGTAASDIVAGARTPATAAGRVPRGVRVVRFDYDDPATLRAGLQGIDRFVLVSLSMPWTATNQHDRVIEAAAEAGVRAMVYTSVYRASETALPLAPIHVAAERAIAASGVPTVLLRNNSYLELFTSVVRQGARTGTIQAAGGDGRIAGASRRDLAEAAAVAIGDDLYLGRTLELAGDTAYSYADLAAIAQQLSGHAVEYRPLSPKDLVSTLTAGGVDRQTIRITAAIDEAIARGDLDATDHVLSQTIGHPTQSLPALLVHGG
jgi:NAD(P)H dehydrogenase (quinone)